MSELSILSTPIGSLLNRDLSIEIRIANTAITRHAMINKPRHTYVNNDKPNHSPF